MMRHSLSESSYRMTARSKLGARNRSCVIHRSDVRSLAFNGHVRPIIRFEFLPGPAAAQPEPKVRKKLDTTFRHKARIEAACRRRQIPQAERSP
jgi:hypothetical protein